MLTEGIDFSWVEKPNPYGYIHSYPQLTDGTLLKRVVVPSANSVVLQSKDNILIPVLILEGWYEVNGRTSNFWYWREVNEDLSLSEIKNGYGHFYESHIKYNVGVSVNKI
ncbi:hypothetical protein [Paenibacillus dendritiformis]|uniref:hypothetical protein n=1 Tax=Paenibacillus dendritiformis TaxID=130049 RepID=UPI00387E0BAC